MKADARAQAIGVFTIIAALIGVGVILQLWLLGAALDGVLSVHKADVARPALGASALLFAVHVGLSAYVVRIDRRVRRER